MSTSNTIEFIDTAGFLITVDPAMIKHVARPKAAYPGEIELTTGAKWGFGGTNTMRDGYYKRALAAFKQAQEAKVND